jgi:hypothetical protein
MNIEPNSPHTNINPVFPQITRLSSDSQTGETVTTQGIGSPGISQGYTGLNKLADSLTDSQKDEVMAFKETIKEMVQSGTFDPQALVSEMPDFMKEMIQSKAGDISDRAAAFVQHIQKGIYDQKGQLNYSDTEFSNALDALFDDDDDEDSEKVS